MAESRQSYEVLKELLKDEESTEIAWSPIELGTRTETDVFGDWGIPYLANRWF